AGYVGGTQAIRIEAYLETGPGKRLQPSEHIADCVRLPGRHVEGRPLREPGGFDEAKIGVYDVLDIEEVALRREVSHPQPRLLLAAFDACDLRCKRRQGKALILPRTRMVERARYDQARALRQHVGKHRFGRGLGS